MRIILMAVLLLLTTSCNPLRKAHRTQKIESSKVDKSEIQKMVTEMLRQEAVLSQTIIEFYPPTSPEHKSEDKTPKPEMEETLTEPITIKPPPVRRVVMTEVSANSQKQTSTDSTVHKNIDTVIRNELDDDVVEKPPSSVTAVKWITASLALILIMITLLKLPRK